MKKFVVVAVFVAAVMAVMSCDKATNDKDDNNGAFDGILVNLPEWVKTKTIGESDLAVADIKVGENLAVADTSGLLYCFTVVESELGQILLQNPEVELIDGASYRLLYPFPEGRESVFRMALGFGGYAENTTLDWMLSEWETFNKDEQLSFNLQRVNSVMLFDIVAPFDGVVEELRISSETADFCLKGAFDYSAEGLLPDRTTYTSQYQFPHRNLEWVKGEKYTLLLTIWPCDYSDKPYTLDIYMADDQGASVAIQIGEMKPGTIKDYNIEEWEVLPAPVYKKDVREEERVGDEVVATCDHPGELY